MTTSMGVPYSAGLGVWKSIKDGIMVVSAGIIAWVGANALGLVEQCPDATITIGGTAIALKVIMQFANNYRKNV